MKTTTRSTVTKTLDPRPVDARLAPGGRHDDLPAAR